MHNLSNLGSAELAAVAAAFEGELQKRGVLLEGRAAPVTVVLTVSQSPTEYLGVVQIQGKETGEAQMETLGPLSDGAAANTAFSYTLHKELLFSQDQPILDVAFQNGGTQAMVLSAHEIYFYARDGGSWTVTRSQGLPVHAASQPIAPGALEMKEDGSGAAFVPGQVCQLAAPGGTAWSCQPSSEPLPALTIFPENWPSATDNNWISAAKLEPEGKMQIVVAGRDGLARLFEGGTEPSAVFPDWGSQLTALHSSCGSEWQLLITGKGDWTKNDEVRAVEIRERTAVPVSSPVEFPGPIIAMHAPSITPSALAPANSTAIALDRNLQSGRYEAYRLTLSCTD